MLKTVNVPSVVPDYNNKTFYYINEDFKVTLNGVKVDAYQARVSAMPFNRVYEGIQRNMNQTEIIGFVSFEADEPVVVEVESVKAFKRAIVRPLSKNVTTEIVNDKVCFTLTKKGQYNLELDDEHTSLTIFYNDICEFGKKEDYTYYYGKGIHYVGVLNLQSGDKVYIDKDAIVLGGIYAKDADGVLIEGYGVFNDRCFNRLERGLFNRGNILMENCKNITIRGPIFLDSCIWVAAFFNCSDIVMDNVKVTGQWRYNTDGIDFCNCKNVVLKNSYVHAFDDVIVLKAQSHFEKNTIEVMENIVIDNCILWCGWGRTIEVGIETLCKEMRNVKYSNCDLIHNSFAALSIRNGNNAKIHDFVYENINVEFQTSTMPEVYQRSYDQVFDAYGQVSMPHLIWFVNHQYGLGKGFEEYDKRVRNYNKDNAFGTVENITVKNVNIYAEEGLPKFKMEIYSSDKEKSFKNISITGVKVNGEKANIDDFHTDIDPRIENLTLFD